MSHTMNINTRFRDISLLRAYCQQLGLKLEEGAVVKFHSTTESGIAIYLDGWKYPVVVQADGTIKYDNYNGTWGKTEKLQDLMQGYAAEAIKIELMKKGLSYNEEINDREEIEMTILIEED